MKFLISKLTLIVCATALNALDTTDYFLLYKNTPVPIINRTGGSETNLYLVRMDDQDLIFRFNPNDRREIGIPLDTEDLQLFYKPSEDFQEAINLIKMGDMKMAVEEMREEAYPLMQYITIPTGNINIHQYIERFAYALTNSPENVSEAVAFFNNINLNELPPVYSQYALQLVDKLVEDKKDKAALALLDKLPLKGDSSLLPTILKFANQLRKDGNIEQALFLYQRIQQVEGTIEADLAQLWIAYCNVELDRIETARLFLEQAGELEPSAPGFGLASLIRGNIAIVYEQPTEAMKAISRGVVYTDVSDDWAPELIFKAGSLYEQFKKPDTAREIYDEIMLFYPSTVWAEKSKVQLEGLPPKTPKPEPEPESGA